MNKGNRALSIKEWFFCIMALLILITLIVLPPVFRIVFEEENISSNKTPTPSNDNDLYPKKTPTPFIDDSQYEKLICTKEEDKEGFYYETETLTFAYQDSELKIFIESNKKNYNLEELAQNDLFSKDKEACDSIPTSYLTITGFNYTCSSLENEVEITQKFDLSEFKEKSVTENKETRVFTTPYYFGQNVRLIKRDLEKKLYVCNYNASVEPPSEIEENPQIEDEMVE